MTKHIDENTLKTQLSLENQKIAESTTELVCDEALVICGRPVKPLQKIAPVKVKVNIMPSKAGKIVDKLYDLEQSGEAEKPLNVDLDLYQMENY